MGVMPEEMPQQKTRPIISMEAALSPFWMPSTA